VEWKVKTLRTPGWFLSEKLPKPTNLTQLSVSQKLKGKAFLNPPTQEVRKTSLPPRVEVNWKLKNKGFQV